MNPILPSDLVMLAGRLHDEGILFGAVATDTETSGLYEDDGARISTASVAFVVHREMVPHIALWAAEGRITVRTETITPDYKVEIASIAWPFDQGLDDKPEAHGKMSLFPDYNLHEQEWGSLLVFLEGVGAQSGLVMHNSKFDVGKYAVGVRRWPGNGIELMDHTLWDTQTTNNQLWPLEKTGLKASCARLFGQEFEDEAAKVKSYLHKSKLPTGRWDLMPWDIIGPYADMDARLTMMLFLRQMIEIQQLDQTGFEDQLRPDPTRISRREFGQLQDRRLKFTRALRRMEKKGLPYDEVGSKLAGVECGKRAERIGGGLPFKPLTGDAAKKYWFGKMEDGGQGLIPYGTSDKTGEPSLTAEIVARMVTDGVEYARIWAEYQKVKMARSMWYDGYAERMGVDGRLRTCFRQNGTVSTRVSVERVNLQAIPADYRLGGYESLDGIPTPRQLIAAGVPEGWGIWELDLAQAELRVGALYSKCTPMLDMMASGVDLHDFTTKNLFGLEKDDPQWGKYRQVGKRGNFSLGFDSGPDTFAGMVSKETGIILPERESKRIVREWRELFPEWHDACTRAMDLVISRQRRHGYGWVRAENGERRWFAKYEDAHKAFNQKVQINLAQFGIDWTLATDAYLEQFEELEEFGGGLILTIHDSQVLLLPLDRGQEMADQCAQFASDLWVKWFPGVGGGSEAKAWKAAA